MIRVFLITLFLISSFLFGQEVSIPPKPKMPVPVYDYIGLLSPQQKSYLDSKLSKYYDSTSTQIVIAILNSVKPNDINLFAAEWAENWGIGQEGKDNGIFILLAKNDRKITIRTGYGVEGKLTTLLTNQIIQNYITPNFKNEMYFEGLDEGTSVIIEVLKGEFKNDVKKKNGKSKLLLILILIIIVVIFISSKKNGGDGSGGRGGDRAGIGGANALLMGMFLGSMGRGSYGGGGSFGNSGFGGGFGAGSFSGGGSSGGW